MNAYPQVESAEPSSGPHRDPILFFFHINILKRIHLAGSKMIFLLD